MYSLINSCRRHGPSFDCYLMILSIRFRIGKMNMKVSLNQISKKGTEDDDPCVSYCLRQGLPMRISSNQHMTL